MYGPFCTEDGSLYRDLQEVAVGNNRIKNKTKQKLYLTWYRQTGDQGHQREGVPHHLVRPLHNGTIPNKCATSLYHCTYFKFSVVCKYACNLSKYEILSHTDFDDPPISTLTKNVGVVDKNAIPTLWRANSTRLVLLGNRLLFFQDLFCPQHC